MLRALLVTLDVGSPPAWSLQDVAISRVRSCEEALESLERTSYDVIVLVATAAHPPTALFEEVAGRIEASIDGDVAPLLFAARCDLPGALDVLSSSSFDGFLDSSWSETLVERCLLQSVHRVRSGRGIAAIQQQVLVAVRSELSVLRDLSVRDELTGLYNYRYFREVLAREHQRCTRHWRSYALICFDVDNLRELNNTSGHAVGSRALERVGAALSSTVRRADYAFRTGGDEFVVLLTETGYDGAQQFAERLGVSLRQCVLNEADRSLKVSVSAGVAAFPAHGASADDVLRRADEALYRAKSTGRNRVVRFGESA